MHKGSVPRVSLPPTLTSCIVITPDGTVSTYRHPGVHRENLRALRDAANLHHELIHDRRRAHVVS